MLNHTPSNNPVGLHGLVVSKNTFQVNYHLPAEFDANHTQRLELARSACLNRWLATRAGKTPWRNMGRPQNTCCRWGRPVSNYKIHRKARTGDAVTYDSCHMISRAIILRTLTVIIMAYFSNIVMGINFTQLCSSAKRSRSAQVPCHVPVVPTCQ